jgi:hypothetical protein
MSLAFTVAAINLLGILWWKQCRWSTAKPERNPCRLLHADRDGDVRRLEGGHLSRPNCAVEQAAMLFSEGSE